MPIGRSVLTGKPQHAAGKRDVLMTIQSSPAPTGGSFPSEAWTDVEDVWMSRVEQMADERFAVAQESAFTQTVWTAPYVRSLDPDLVDVTARRRLKLETRDGSEVYERIYNIRAATVRGRKDAIELLTLAAGAPTLQEED